MCVLLDALGRCGSPVGSEVVAFYITLTRLASGER
jgi:hypothetical protein